MKTLSKILFLIGLILLGVTVYGLFRTMRNPAIFSKEQIIRNRINDITIGYPEILDSLKRKDHESNIQFAVRINKVVNDGFIHYWKDEGIKKYHIRVPIWENYLLHFASYIDPKTYRKYEFTNYKKNLERGVGLCSTHSIVVRGVLMEQGIKAELLGAGLERRHVVVRAELGDGVVYLLDPDYGIVIPHDTAAITANPELVREPYSNMASLYYSDAIDPYTTNIMVEIFGNRKHVYYPYYRFERFSYWAIWVIPFLLMFPFGLYFFRKRSAIMSSNSHSREEL